MKPVSLWIVALAATLLILDIFVFATVYYNLKEPGDWNGTEGERLSYDEAVFLSMKNLITCSSEVTAKSTRARSALSVQLGISILSILVLVLLELEN